MLGCFRSKWVLVIALLLPRVALGDEVPRGAPSAEERGDVRDWTTKSGLEYRYRVPEDYDPERGAALTFILHGSNLSKDWGFANHAAESFRPHDIVVCPNGTTSNGGSGYNFLGEKKDVELLRALQRELAETFNVTATYLYGHSQGSFFALHYAGAHPKEVDGVVAHASGVWNGSQLGAKGHHQAIVLMHGTQDPVVPYGQSVGGYESFVKKKYPLVRLRSLEGWNHWPSEHNFGPHGNIPHTSHQLAWVEGMTSDDPERVRRCFDLLTDVTIPQRHDWAAVYTLAARIASWDDAPSRLKSRAKSTMRKVDALAAAHVKALKVSKKPRFDGEPWIGHLPMFLRTFAGVPRCDQYAAQWEKPLSSQQSAAVKQLKKYWAAREKNDAPAAFKAGVAALEQGFLYHECQDRELAAALEEYAKDPKGNKLDKRSLAEWKELHAALGDARRDGAEAFDRLNQKHGDR